MVRPARSVAGALRLPGDKSVSHRYAMLAAIAEGDTRLENFSTGADCASTLGCVRALGVEVRAHREQRRHSWPRPEIAGARIATRLRQLRIHHADVERHPGGTGFRERAYRR